MFRHCIPFLVIAGLFAGQLAALPHAHATISAKERQKHDATPHFHCRWPCHADHGHNHSHGGHRHEHGGQPQPPRPERPADDPSGSLPTFDLVGMDHDATAVFVPVQVSVPSTANQEDSAASAALGPDLVAIDDIADARRCLRAKPHWHPPDVVLDDSDTYLTLRNLRI